MLKPYRTIQDVLTSPWARQPQAERTERTDRVLRSTKLENNIYHDLRTEDIAMGEIEQSAGEKLKSFPALSQDVFQSFYSLMPGAMTRRRSLRRRANSTHRSWSISRRARNIPRSKRCARDASFRPMKRQRNLCLRRLRN